MCLWQWLKLCFLTDLKFNIRLNSDLLCQMCQHSIWLCIVQANPGNSRWTTMLQSHGPIGKTSLSHLLGFRQYANSVTELTIKKATVLGTALQYKTTKCKTGELAIWSGARWIHRHLLHLKWQPSPQRNYEENKADKCSFDHCLELPSSMCPCLLILR